MKRRLILVSIFFSISILIASNSSAAGGGLANEWIKAMMNQGAGLNNLITPDFQYTHYSFDSAGRLYKGKRGDISFFAKTSKPTEINIEETNSGYGGQIVKLNAVAETGLYRDWDIYLLVTPSGVSRVTEIAKEGTFEGYPAGCPETMFKRDLVVSLHGSPAGMGGPKLIQLYTTRSDTDSLDYANTDTEEKELKKCRPKPDTYLIEEEVIVFDSNGQLEFADVVANKYKGSSSDTGYGAMFFSEDGTNFPGRLFDIGGGKEGLLLTFTVERGSGGGSERIDPAILYEWKGGGWKPIWSFTAGFGSMKGFMGSAADQVEWSIRSTGAGGEPGIIAQLESNEDKGFNCPIGTTIRFTKSGSGFKPDKGSPGSCLKGSSVSAGSLKSGGKGFKLPTVKGSEMKEEEDN